MSGNLVFESMREWRLQAWVIALEAQGTVFVRVGAGGGGRAAVPLSPSQDLVSKQSRDEALKDIEIVETGGFCHSPGKHISSQC